MIIVGCSNIRDENYKNCNNMTTQGKIEYTRKLANKFSSYHSEKLQKNNSLRAKYAQCNKAFYNE